MDKAQGPRRLVLGPVEFIERLARLIPPPRKNVVRYYGAMGPNSPLRPLLNEAAAAPSKEPLLWGLRRAVAKVAGAARASARRWARLLSRVFEVDPLTGSIVGLAASGDLTLCYDARVLAEYREVLLRPKFELDAQAVDDFLAQVEAEGEPVTAAPLPQRLADRSDEPFLEVALGSRAECLVTGNREDFPTRPCCGVRVLSPAEFVDAFRRRP